MKNIGLITYDVPHRKTQDILLGLLLKGSYHIRLITIPFSPRKEREVLFNHRPFQFAGPGPDELAEKFGLEILSLTDMGCFSGLDHCLVGGAGLIPEKLLKENFIINAHAGLMPLSRGLDSFKWAIRTGKPLGVSLHFIDNQVDSGTLISSVTTPVFRSDSIQSLAERHYYLEMEMLINFEQYLHHPVIVQVENSEPTRRMPLAGEQIMLEQFGSWKERFA